MDSSWSIAIKFVLDQEGGYVFHKDDPGGETNFGISKKSYPNLDIKNLTVKQAIEIYKKDYWDKVGCNYLEYPLDIVVFDTAVNMGTGRALSILEKVTSKDFHLYLLLRQAKYIDIVIANPKMLTFFKGWIFRLNNLFKLAQYGERK